MCHPLEFLIPAYLPLGKLVLIAGDGGLGKSSIMYSITADLTMARPSFGLSYKPQSPAEVLLANCEDDYEDTIVPRLIAAGADLSKVHRIDGVKGPDGKPAPFCMAHFEQIEGELAARPECRFLAIDPAGA